MKKLLFALCMMIGTANAAPISQCHSNYDTDTELLYVPIILINNGPGLANVYFDVYDDFNIVSYEIFDQMYHRLCTEREDNVYVNFGDWKSEPKKPPRW